MPKVVSVFGIDPFRIGGNETFARELSLQLQQKGWQSVLCFLTAPPEEVRTFLQLPNVTIEVLRDSVGVSLSGAVEFCKILHRHQPQIVHLHFINFLGSFPWLARILRVKKFFITDHGSRPAGYVPHRAPFWKRLLVRIINWPVTKVLCVSDYGYRCFTALDLLPTKRFERIYNSVDLKRVQPSVERGHQFKKKFGILAERSVVLQVSWIIPEKGILDLIEAARHVVEQNDRVQFVFVGEGDFRARYEAYAEQVGLDGHITWTGLIADPFNEGVFDAADVVCQVSYWEEVFGWVIAEAMAYSKPMIGTSVGGIPEVIDDGVTGVLVKRGDAQDIAAQILQLLSDPKLREKMGAQGRQAAEEKFNLRTNVGRLLQSYGIDDQSKPISKLNA
jgi:glycosyltransferase involved in cell wall biosynthesis